MASENFIPVYLFTGYLESGKTTFLQSTLEDPSFYSGETTLLLLCEEGEVELDPTAFAGDNVILEIVEEESQLTEAYLETLFRRTKCNRVVVEYNGMWMLDSFYSVMPQSWAVYQEFFFADSRTILSYNDNMRQLTFDKLQSCEMAVFNRFSDQMDPMAYHQLVRTASRRAEILFEYEDGHVMMDTIEDPPPYDLDAPVIDIGDNDYAYFYRDLSEDGEKYEGKTVSYVGRVLTKKMMPGAFIIGRHLMTCCADDIQFAALVAKGDKAMVKAMEHEGWYRITGTIHTQFHVNYGGKGPVLAVTAVEKAETPDPEVATLY